MRGAHEPDAVSEPTGSVAPENRSACPDCSGSSEMSHANATGSGFGARRCSRRRSSNGIVPNALTWGSAMAELQPLRSAVHAEVARLLRGTECDFESASAIDAELASSVEELACKGILDPHDEQRVQALVGEAAVRAVQALAEEYPQIRRMQRSLALGITYNRFRTHLFGYFRKRGVPSEDCEDLAQEVGRRTSQSVGALKDVLSIREWFWKAPLTVYKDYLKKTRGRPPHGELSDEMPGPNPLEGIIVARMLLRKAQKFIERLPSRQAQVYVLSCVDGLANEVIAERMEISTATVKRELAKARERLKAVERALRARGLLDWESDDTGES